jgi:protein-tyrosine-phosphatase
MAQRGLDLSQHRARTVTRAMLQQFDLVLVMEANHKEALRIEFPDLRQKIFLLSEMVGKKINVDDPIGGKISDYQVTADVLDGYFAQGWQRILELVQP